jgi:hypothetical protein
MPDIRQQPVGADFPRGNLFLSLPGSLYILNHVEKSLLTHKHPDRSSAVMKAEKTPESPNSDDSPGQKEDPLERRRLQNRLSQRNHRKSAVDRTFMWAKIKANTSQAAKLGIALQSCRNV